MKIALITALNKRIPRRWWMLLGVVMSVYIISTFFLTIETPLTSRSDHEPNPSLFQNLNHPAFLKEGTVQLKRNVEDVNYMKHNKIQEMGHIRAVSDTKKVKAQSEIQSEDGLQEKEPEQQLVLEEPTEVHVPHLYFNEEGIGQGGIGVTINKTSLSKDDQQLYDQGYERNCFNEYLSNFISVDRKIRQARDPLCENEAYPSDLPDTSVIMCFLNEAWSVLVRSVHSVINTSPPHLLREIILVDDYSDYDHLKAPLEKYMEKFPKVKIIRNKEREGLIRSRLNGAKVATGQVLTFLDSHIECTTGWLPPLLARIKENSSHVVWPFIPTINGDTFEFEVKPRAADVQVGVFTWSMVFAWQIPNVTDRETVISPVRSPTMAGGLFSIDRDYFYHVGSYDDEMQFWGGENIEMSFRIWMCGGTIEVIPCSIVGHVYRFKNVNAGDSTRGTFTYNNLRLVMVWLDQYKYFYSNITRNKLENYGDISSRLELRQKLKCKSFEWYLANVYKSVFKPQNSLIIGLIHSVHDSSKCLEAYDEKDKVVYARDCNNLDLTRQVFYMTEDEEIRLLTNCLDLGRTQAMMFPCHKQKGAQQLTYRQDKTIWKTGMCLQWIEHLDHLELLPCDNSTRQKWVWERLQLDFLPKSDRNIQH